MSTRNSQNGRNRSRERTPLGPGYNQTSYGASDPVPRAPGGPQPPPPYATAQRDPIREQQEALQFGLLAWIFIALLFICFYFIPTKVNGYIDAVAQLRIQQDAMKQETKLLEAERLSLEHERLLLKEEREKWEKAHDGSRVPQGAFWEVVWPRWECRSYGKREYWGILRNIPGDRNDIDACINMPVDIKGVTVKRPERCEFVEGSPYVHGFWMVDWDQTDCKPWHQDFKDRGCTNPGSGTRRIEAEVAGINRKGQQDWHVLCETTPMTWNHITYPSPTHCDERGNKKIAMWDIADDRC